MVVVGEKCVGHCHSVMDVFDYTNLQFSEGGGGIKAGGEEFQGPSVCMKPCILYMKHRNRRKITQMNKLYIYMYMYV